MKASEVYLRAAEYVDKFDYAFSCSAITFVSDQFHPPDRDRYITTFADGKYKSSTWLTGPYNERGWTDEEYKQWRVLALLFMHQIAKDEEKS